MATKGDISGLPVLQFGGVPLVPQVRGYSRRNGINTVQSDVAGGATRQRKKRFGSTHRVTATFYGDTALVDYLQLFFYDNEGAKFICHLQADRPIVEPYVVQVVSGWDQPSATAVDGEFRVTMEVFPARDKCLDEFLRVAYPCMGSDLCAILRGYGEIVRRMPNGN